MEFDAAIGPTICKNYFKSISGVRNIWDTLILKGIGISAILCQDLLHVNALKYLRPETLH